MLPLLALLEVSRGDAIPYQGDEHPLAPTLPISNSIHPLTQPNLAPPGMAEEGKVERERWPVPFLPTCTHNQTRASHAFKLHPSSHFTGRWVESYRLMSSTGECKETAVNIEIIMMKTVEGLTLEIFRISYL